MNWLSRRAHGVGDALLANLIWIALGVVGVAVWGFVRGDVTLPVWLLVAAVGVPVVFAFTMRRRGGVPPAEVARLLSELETENALFRYYARFSWEALQTLQADIRGDLQGVTLDDLVEQGLLAPAREFLRQAPGEDVRLSVLVPDGSDFRMAWAAGHRLASKHAFRLPISGSFSEIAYETGAIQWSNDVASDPRFRPHPQAERPYASIVSVPIRAGENGAAVLNTVSTLPFAFTPPDFVLVVIVGALVEVAWAMGRLDAAGDDQPPDEGDGGGSS